MRKRRVTTERNSTQRSMSIAATKADHAIVFPTPASRSPGISAVMVRLPGAAGDSLPCILRVVPAPLVVQHHDPSLASSTVATW
jgi:hypothetical protein